jgi:hypothetical protein
MGKRGLPGSAPGEQQKGLPEPTGTKEQILAAPIGNLLKTILTIKGAPEITALFENFGLSIIPEEAQVLMKLIARGKEKYGIRDGGE